MSLILLGCELRVLYHCSMCTRHPDLVSLDFYDCHRYHNIPHSNLLVIIYSNDSNEDVKLQPDHRVSLSTQISAIQ